MIASQWFVKVIEQRHDGVLVSESREDGSMIPSPVMLLA
jgi:hypothetical protein